MGHASRRAPAAPLMRHTCSGGLLLLLAATWAACGVAAGDPALAPTAWRISLGSAVGQVEAELVEVPVPAAAVALRGGMLGRGRLLGELYRRRFSSDFFVATDALAVQCTHEAGALAGTVSRQPLECRLVSGVVLCTGGADVPALLESIGAALVRPLRHRKSSTRTTAPVALLTAVATDGRSGRSWNATSDLSRCVLVLEPGTSSQPQGPGDEPSLHCVRRAEDGGCPLLAPLEPRGVRVAAFAGDVAAAAAEAPPTPAPAHGPGSRRVLSVAAGTAGDARSAHPSRGASPADVLHLMHPLAWSADGRDAGSGEAASSLLQEGLLLSLLETAASESGPALSRPMVDAHRDVADRRVAPGPAQAAPGRGAGSWQRAESLAPTVGRAWTATRFEDPASAAQRVEVERLIDLARGLASANASQPLLAEEPLCPARPTLWPTYQPGRLSWLRREANAAGAFVLGSLGGAAGPSSPTARIVIYGADGGADFDQVWLGDALKPWQFQLGEVVLLRGFAQPGNTGLFEVVQRPSRNVLRLDEILPSTVQLGRISWLSYEHSRDGASIVGCYGRTAGPATAERPLILLPPSAAAAAARVAPERPQGLQQDAHLAESDPHAGAPSASRYSSLPDDVAPTLRTLAARSPFAHVVSLGWGLHDFEQGEIVMLSGFARPGNEGLFRVVNATVNALALQEVSPCEGGRIAWLRSENNTSGARVVVQGGSVIGPARNGRGLRIRAFVRHGDPALDTATPELPGQWRARRRSGEAREPGAVLEIEPTLAASSGVLEALRPGVTIRLEGFLHAGNRGVFRVRARHGALALGLDEVEPENYPCPQVLSPLPSDLIPPVSDLGHLLQRARETRERVRDLRPPPPPAPEPVLCPLACTMGHRGWCAPGSNVCVCNPTWRGPHCLEPAIPCPLNCSARGRCDPRTGRCACDATWTGPACETRALLCPLDCSGRGVCSPLTGKCACPDSWFGVGCEKRVLPCPSNCSDSHGACDFTTGKCVCEPTWAGVACQRPHIACPFNCSGHGVCDSTIGRCDCEPLYTHRLSCSARASPCPHNCIDAHHGICDEDTGRCACKRAWTGVDCGVPKCGHHGTMMRDGSCGCDEGWFQRNRTAVCDIDGVAACRCDRRCVADRGVQDTCGSHALGCSTSGECLCRRGWAGEQCEVPLIRTGELNQQHVPSAITAAHFPDTPMRFCKAAYALFAECRSPILPRPVLLAPDLECVLTTKNRSVDTPEERAQIAHRILAHSAQRHVYFSHFILECLAPSSVAPLRATQRAFALLDANDDGVLEAGEVELAVAARREAAERAQGLRRASLVHRSGSVGDLGAYARPSKRVAWFPAAVAFDGAGECLGFRVQASQVHSGSTGGGGARFWVDESPVAEGADGGAPMYPCPHRTVAMPAGASPTVPESEVEALDVGEVAALAYPTTANSGAPGSARDATPRPANGSAMVGIVQVDPPIRPPTPAEITPDDEDEAAAFMDACDRNFDASVTVIELLACARVEPAWLLIHSPSRVLVEPADRDSRRWCSVFPDPPHGHPDPGCLVCEPGAPQSMTAIVEWLRRRGRFGEAGADDRDASRSRRGGGGAGGGARAQGGLASEGGAEGGNGGDSAGGQGGTAGGNGGSSGGPKRRRGGGADGGESGDDGEDDGEDDGGEDDGGDEEGTHTHTHSSSSSSSESSSPDPGNEPSSTGDPEGQGPFSPPNPWEWCDMDDIFGNVFCPTPNPQFNILIKMMIPGAIRPIIDMLGAAFMKGQAFTNDLIECLMPMADQVGPRSGPAFIQVSESTSPGAVPSAPRRCTSKLGVEGADALASWAKRKPPQPVGHRPPAAAAGATSLLEVSSKAEDESRMQFKASVKEAMHTAASAVLQTAASERAVLGAPQGKMVPNLKKAIYEALVHPTGASITQLVTYKMSKALHQQLHGALAQSLQPRLQSSITHGLIHVVGNSVPLILSKTVPQLISSLLPPFLFHSLTQSLTHTVTRALAHSLTPSLTSVLSVSPHQQYWCYHCKHSREHCDQCHSSAAGELHTALYYSNYYTAYYSDYFADYYAQHGFSLLT